MSVPFVTANSKKNNDWAYNSFIARRDADNCKEPENPCSQDLLYRQLFEVSALLYCTMKFAQKQERNIRLLPSFAFLVVYSIVCEPFLMIAIIS